MSTKYEILHDGCSPVVCYCLEKNEKIKAEADAMIAMSATIDIEGKAEGGLFKGLARKLTGESFFFQYLAANRGPGEVILGHAIPGNIIAVEFDGSTSLTVQKGSFLACTEDIQIDTKMQSLGKGLLSGEGFFVISVSGRGTLFLSSYGAIHTISLGPGEEYIIDNGHLVAWPSIMSYKVEKAAKGILNSLKSGEGLVCRFTGPGKVMIQTRNPGGLVSWLAGLGLGGSQ